MEKWLFANTVLEILSLYPFSAWLFWLLKMKLRSSLGFSLGLGEGKQLVCGLGQLGSQMSGDLLLKKFKMAFQAKLVRIVKLKQ